jgi:predicted transcriptional regulator
MGYEPVAKNTLILASDHNHGVALSIDLARHYERPQLLHGIRALAGVTLPD